MVNLINYGTRYAYAVSPLIGELEICDASSFLLGQPQCSHTPFV